MRHEVPARGVSAGVALKHTPGLPAYPRPRRRIAAGSSTRVFGCRDVSPTPSHVSLLENSTLTERGLLPPLEPDGVDLGQVD